MNKRVYYCEINVLVHTYMYVTLTELVIMGESIDANWHHAMYTRNGRLMPNGFKVAFFPFLCLMLGYYALSQVYG